MTPPGLYPGPRNAITDVPGIRVGHASAADRLTGTTVILPVAPCVAAASVMGGAPGTRSTNILDPASVMTEVHAITLSGGSAFGLDAAGGTMDRLRAEGIGFRVGAARVPIVPSAIIFDLTAGPNAEAPTGWESPPWFALGQAATDAALATGLPPRGSSFQGPGSMGPGFALGAVGAGRGARAGRIRGGLGTASLIRGDAGPGSAIVAALAVANPVGEVLIPGSRAFWAAPYEREGEFGAIAPPKHPLAPEALDFPFDAVSAGSNTTLAVVATDLALDRDQCARVALMAQDGLARAIRPVHSPLDGDTVFVMATGARPLADPIADTARAGMMAADCVARAIARAVHAAPSQRVEDAGLPAWCDLDDTGDPS